MNAELFKVGCPPELGAGLWVELHAVLPLHRVGTSLQERPPHQKAHTCPHCASHDVLVAQLLRCDLLHEIVHYRDALCNPKCASDSSAQAGGCSRGSESWVGVPATDFILWVMPSNIWRWLSNVFWIENAWPSTESSSRSELAIELRSRSSACVPPLSRLAL